MGRALSAGEARASRSESTTSAIAVFIGQIDMGPVGEDLNRLEPVSRDLHDVIAVEPMIVVQVRRYAELQGAHAGSGCVTEHPSI